MHKIKFLNLDMFSKHDKKIYISFVLIFVFSFIFSSEIRNGILRDGRFATLNYVCILSILYLLYKSVKSSDKYGLLLSAVTMGYLVISSMFYQMRLSSIVVCIISFVIPLILLNLEINALLLKRIFQTLLIILSIIMIIITIIGIADYFTHYKVILVIRDFVSESMKRLIRLQAGSKEFRMYSFMGHPLFNTELYLMFYVLNILYNKFYKKSIIPNYVVMIITIVGISLTASKTGFALLALLLLTLNGKKINYKYYIGLIILVAICFHFGLFDNVINRFMQGDLTSSRSRMWEVVSKNNMYPIKFFTGYGQGFTFIYNRIVPDVSAAFEYPVRMFSLELGIFTTILIYLNIFIYPMYKFIKRKQYSIIIGYLIVFLDINTYNGLSLAGDYMLIFCIFTFILLNLSNVLYKKSIELVSANRDIGKSGEDSTTSD